MNNIFKLIASLVAFTFGILVLKACEQPAIKTSSRTQIATGDSANQEQPSRQEEPEPEPEPETTDFQFSWTDANDANITEYKVFLVAPENVPQEIKRVAMADITTAEGTSTVNITKEEVQTILGDTILAAGETCFTIVAVNGVGNSQHSDKVCPQ